MMVVSPDCSKVTADCGLILMNAPFPRLINTFFMSDFVLATKLIWVFWERSMSLACISLIGISFVHNAFLINNVHSWAH